MEWERRIIALISLHTGLYQGELLCLLFLLRADGAPRLRRWFAGVESFKQSSAEVWLLNLRVSCSGVSRDAAGGRRGDSV